MVGLKKVRKSFVNVNLVYIIFYTFTYHRSFISFILPHLTLFLMFISHSNENTYISFYVIRSIIILFTLFILYFIAPTFLVSCAHLSFLALTMLLNQSTPLVQPPFHLVQLFPRINLLFPCLHSPSVIVSVSSFSYSFRIS